MTTKSFVLSIITITAVAYTFLFFTVCIISFSEKFRALGDVDKLLGALKRQRCSTFPSLSSLDFGIC